MRSWVPLLLLIGCFFLLHACVPSDQPQFTAEESEAIPGQSDPFVGAEGGGGLAFPQFVPGDTYVAPEEEADTSTPSSNDIPDSGSIQYADVAPAEGLACDQIMSCMNLCSYRQGQAKLLCEDACFATGSDEGKPLALTFLSCVQAAGCLLTEDACWDAVCSEEWEACLSGGESGEEEGGDEGGEEGGGQEELDPSKPPLSCGGTPGVVCPETPTSPLQVSMQHIKTSLPPTLAGGALLDGSYGLTNIEVYSSSMLAGGALPVNFEFTDNQSRGTVRIDGDSWSFLAELGLQFDSELGGNSFLGIQQGGGCISVHEGEVIGDILQCYQGTPDDNEVPTNFPYEMVGSDVRFMIQFPVSGIKAALSGSFAGDLASSLLVNDLKVVITLSPL